jgi:hypothetical protein
MRAVGADGRSRRVSFVKAFEGSAVKKDGKVRMRNRKSFEDWSERLREGQEVAFTFEPAHATRSLDQNALYWAGYVQPIAEYTGNSPKWVHAYLKHKFLPKQRIEIVDKKTGVIIDEVNLDQLTTTVLNKIEFGEYLRKIEEWVLDEFHGNVTVGSNREHAA